MIEPEQESSQTNPPIEEQATSTEENEGVSSKKPKKHSILLIILSVAVVIIGATIGSSYIWYKQQLQSVSNRDKLVQFDIESGTGADQIISNLKTEGLIKNEVAFRIYLRRHNYLDRLQAGSYSLSPSLSAQQTAETIVLGKVATVDITIPPGLRLSQIAKIITDKGYSSQSVEKAFTTNYDSVVYRSKPKEASLEVLIYPETYRLKLSDDPESLIAESFKLYDKAITDEVIIGLANKNLTLYQGITLASIVQLEVAKADIQPAVAQVFLKRLKDGMNLGSDVTFIYAAKETNQVATPSLDSPYNTRINSGLPPTPIANFNFSALKAVVDPAEGDYVYFVAGDDGAVYFARTLEEHEQNVSNYCKKSCGAIVN